MSSRKKVLIVDDSPTVRGQIRAALEADHVCVEAVDGAHGLELALTESPDAMVIDLEMPQLSGTKLLEQLKANPTTMKIPVIVVTTTTDVQQMNRCRALGCAGIVLKPVDAGYLNAKLRSLLKPRP